MARRSRLLLGIIVLAIAGTARADNSDIRVNVVVDVLPAGKGVPKPTPDQPAYYVMLPAGIKDLGEPEPPSHFQDRPPPPVPEVVQLLARSLAEQGYLPATRRTPPSLILVCEWGYVNPHLMPVGRRSPPIIVDEEEVVPIVAGHNTDVQIMQNMPPWMDEVIHAERQARYYLKVTAFDFQAWRNHHAIMLWQAHVSVPLWGHYLYEVMPTLVTAGVPAFGRQTGRPQMFTTTIVPSGHVVVGTPYVKSYPAAPPATPPAH